MSKPFFEEIQSWKGKRITYSNIMKAPWGHISNCLILLVFDDGSRTILCTDQYGSPIWGFKDLSVEEMQKHPDFFTPDDIADVLRQQEIRRRENNAQAKEARRREFERLQQEFGQTDAGG
jgi:hypothetical protein